ncbi:MAG: GAF domain-containing protein [Chloroflexota bacterium]
MSSQNTNQIQEIGDKVDTVVVPELSYRRLPFAAEESENKPVWRVRLELASDPTQRIGLLINGEVVLGRDIEGEDTINLAPFDAGKFGMSRRHLMLRPTASHLYATDLGSTNGTTRNGRSIGVRTPYPLTSGDMLSLGKLRIGFTIEERPHFQTGILEKKIDLADALTEIAKSITSQLDLDQVLNQMVETAMTLTSAGETSIWLVDEVSGDLFLEAQRGIEDETITRMRLPIDGESLAGKVITTGQPMRVWRQPGEDQIKVKTNYLVEALAYVPLTLGGVTFGVLAATHRESGKRFDNRDERLLAAIADFAAIAVQNARTYQATDRALARRYEELSALNEVSRAVSSSLDLDTVYTVLVEQVNHYWPVESVCLSLVDEQGQKLRKYRQAPKTNARGTRPFALNEGIIGYVAQSGEVVMANNPETHEAYNPFVDNINGQIPASMVSVPLHVQNHVVGVLTLFNKADGSFVEQDVDRLTAFANPVATAVENARLFKESERQRAAIQATAHTLSQPLLIIDEAGDVLVANEAATVLLGAHMAQLFEAISSGIGQTMETKIGEKTYLSTAEHLAEVGTILVMQDITYVKQLEADREDFLHMLSHDLKNPLTAIMGWKSLLERTAELDSRGERYLKQIGVAVDRMLIMIEQLLYTVTDNSAVSLMKKPFDFNKVVERVQADVAGAALNKAISLTCAITGERYDIEADENRLYHMLLNLVDNALKYSPRETAVSVQVLYTPEQLIIHVFDEGAGIPEDDLALVFEKYFRGDKAKAQPGSGLGLSAVRVIVQAHGGSIGVVNRPEGGAHFTVTLPGSLRAISETADV